MKLRLAGFATGLGFGFVLAWARLTDPSVIRNMLLLREPDVFLLMGSAIVVAALGCRVLRSAGVLAFVTGERIQWSALPPQRRHVVGSVLFGVGWSAAGTCPGPAAAMIGQGRLGGVFVVIGILVGVLLQPIISRLRIRDPHLVEHTGAVGL
jgi:uncharacterized membrane protein YedE/YeeE